MANYFLIRGWLECSFDDAKNIHELVADHWMTSSDYDITPESAELYRTGWTFPQNPINWTSLMFFGANVRETSAEFIYSCFSKIAQSGYEVEGYFHIDDDAGDDPKQWTIKPGAFLEIPR